MSISRKHFEAVAKAIADERRLAGYEVQDEPCRIALAAIDTLSRRLADVFADCNPAFDRARFLRAAGITEEA